MLGTVSGISNTQKDIQRLEEFMGRKECVGGRMPTINESAHRLEILLLTGIDLALAAAVMIRQAGTMRQEKPMTIKLVVEA